MEEVLRENITPGKLAIDGSLIMKESGEKPGPRIGHIQHALLAETLQDQRKNTEEYLLKKTKELLKYKSYECFYHPAERPGYSGVAVWVRVKIKIKLLKKV